MFADLGRWCFRHRGKVVLLWLAVLIVVGGISGMLGTAYSTEFALPDVESRRGFDILDEHFAGSGAGGEGERSCSAPSRASPTPKWNER